MPVALPALAGVTHRTVDVDGLAVHVAEAGDGPPLVLLHGWPQHWWCWRHVVPLLAPSYRLVMPDLRGHGWTAAPAGGYDKEQLATDLLALLDQLGIEPTQQLLDLIARPYAVNGHAITISASIGVALSPPQSSTDLLRFADTVVVCLVLCTVESPALALADAARTGQLSPGYSADMALWEADDFREIPYWYGDRRCMGTWARGKPCHAL